MLHLKSPEFRVILILVLFAMAGSAFVLIQRYEKSAQFRLPILENNNGYKYSYSLSDIKEAIKRDSTEAFAKFENVVETEIIDINKCGYYDFEALPGIGPALASRIIAHRDSIGAFGSIEDLLNVNGIGPATLARLRNMIKVQ